MGLVSGKDFVAGNLAEAPEAGRARRRADEEEVGGRRLVPAGGSGVGA